MLAPVISCSLLPTLGGRPEQSHWSILAPPLFIQADSPGNFTKVETTTSIEQGCKLAPSLFALLTGKLYKELVALCGERKVPDYFIGYADDLAIHRTISSVAELEECHLLIWSLLDGLQQHKLLRNSSKCCILAKFAGKMAPTLTKTYTAWTKHEKGAKVKFWRIGKPTTSLPLSAYRS